jgi:TRAP-type mannitol/chloroaromatic compound transport system permease small subunit
MQSLNRSNEQSVAIWVIIAIFIIGMMLIAIQGVSDKREATRFMDRGGLNYDRHRAHQITHYLFGDDER